MKKATWGEQDVASFAGKEKSPFGMFPKGSDVEGNHIYFYEPVSQDSVSNLVCNLQELQTDVRLKFDVYAEKHYTPSYPPIHLHIHSYGGEVFAGFAAVDAILKSPVPIHTHVEGSAASAATFLSIAGTHRTIGRHGFILIHQMTSAFWGKYEEFKDEMLNQTVLMKSIRALYAERTKIPKTKLKEILKKDLWFDAAKALELGLVDEIV